MTFGLKRAAKGLIAGFNVFAPAKSICYTSQSAAGEEELTGPGDGLTASWPGGHAPATGFGLTASAMRGGPDGPVGARDAARRDGMRRCVHRRALA